MKINVIGLGYIGLPTSLILAANDHLVVGTDINSDIVKTLNNGEITFEEQGLEDLFSLAKSKGFRASSKPESAEMYIITVPTPYISESKQIDPKYIISAVKEVLEVIDENPILVIESTVSPGTIDTHIRPIIEASGKNIDLVHAPERILPGAMISELVNNSRTIGADNPRIGETVKEVYESFCKGDIVITDIRTAEMSKVVENTFRDINIAFANELARICRVADLDVYEVIRIANKHPRVNILQPGPGVGGHCISVDPWFLVGDYPKQTNLIHQARETNDEMPIYVYTRILEIMEDKGITDLSRVGLYGITYKEDVDDLRESPTIQMLEKVEDSKKFRLYDPMIKSKLFEQQEMDFDSFMSSIDLVVIMVGHSHVLSQNLMDKVVFDTRNILTNDKTIKL